MDLLKLAEQFKETSLAGRYITIQNIEPLLNKKVYQKGIAIIGSSVADRPIYSYKIGNGVTKVLMWSQMHGNESTTTKALFDFFNFIQSNNELAVLFRAKFSFCFLPMLNPDGAALYTRENANLIDLNRDALILSQPESKILNSVYFDFNPDYCFNLHDQRSIYGVGSSGKAAVLSFLAPSFNENRDVNSTRNKAINIILAINSALSNYISGHTGRFDDTFNINCVGDTFQFLGTPTVLFEAGHFSVDYAREYPRKLLFVSFLSALGHIIENVLVSNKIEKYLLIPQNKVNFYDLIYNNAIYIDAGINKMISFAIQFEELLIGNDIHFFGRIVAINGLENFFGHCVIDCKSKCYSNSSNKYPVVGEVANFNLDNVNVFDNGIKID